MALGDGLPCGFAWAKSSRTSQAMSNQMIRLHAASHRSLLRRDLPTSALYFQLVVGDGLPRTAYGARFAVEPDDSTPRCFASFSAAP